MASEPPKVFISYSHDSPEHARRVLGLAERLRKDGVNAQLDQYVAGTPPEGWPRWMLDRLDWAEFVLVVCTETYYRRSCSSVASTAASRPSSAIRRRLPHLFGELPDSGRAAFPRYIRKS